jgi:acyl transferase domain-containing protein
MQNHTTPPNMHFSELSPAIVPFYDRLEIPTEPREWAGLPAALPLRASVNSFGFGGNNALVILETFLPTAGPRGGRRRACLG